MIAGIAASVEGEKSYKLSEATVGFRASNKMTTERGTVPFCSADFAKSGQSPAILLDALRLRNIEFSKDCVFGVRVFYRGVVYNEL
jgi:hypothetical protein